MVQYRLKQPRRLLYVLNAKIARQRNSFALSEQSTSNLERRRTRALDTKYLINTI
jgi:hypothetical protein